MIAETRNTIPLSSKNSVQRLGKREWWMAAGLSGVICGLLGPQIGVVALFLWTSVLSVILHMGPYPGLHEVLLSLGIMSVYAEVAFGIPGFVLGCCGGLLLKAVATKQRSIKDVSKRGMIVGLVLGSVVPSWLLVTDGWKTVGVLAILGAFSGVVCGLVMTWLLRSRRLLNLSAHQSHA